MTRPTRDEAPTVASGQGFQEQASSDSLDCAASDADAEALSTFQACAAPKGCALHALAGGGYPMSQWSYGREVPDRRAACDLLRRMGA